MLLLFTGRGKKEGKRMKALKILFLIITAPIWLPFWIAWKVLKVVFKVIEVVAPNVKVEPLVKN